MGAPTVFFDLDGTLVDTTYLHTYAWWRALDDAGLGRPMAAIHPLIGMGGSDLLEVLIGHDHPALRDAQGKQFEQLHSLVRRLPGAAELLERVAADGQVVIVTSAKEKDLPALLGPLDCDELISEVIHAEMVERSKPAPDPFAVALERTGADPQRALAVGDSVWDVRAAAKVGMDCLGLQTGGIAPADFQEAGAVAVYRDCSDLLAHWSSGPLAALLG